MSAVHLWFELLASGLPGFMSAWCQKQASAAVSDLCKKTGSLAERIQKRAGIQMEKKRCLYS